jgi:hypothetical protein
MAWAGTGALMEPPENFPQDANAKIPLMEYRRAFVPSHPIELRWDASDLLVLIEPPAIWRFLIIRGIIAGLLLMACALSVTVAIRQWIATDVRGPAVISSVIAIAFGFWSKTAIQTLVRAARHGKSPAILRVSPVELAIELPILGQKSRQQWPRRMIVDVSFRAAGLIPIFLPYIKMQISLIDDTADVILIPSRGSGSLATIEDNIRDVLGLHQVIESRPPSP